MLLKSIVQVLKVRFRAKEAMSIEALAMAGVDCIKFGINLVEMACRDMEKTPEYLLAEKIPCKDDVKEMQQMEEWQVKAVASISIIGIDT
ncbi:hypothetical protein Pint_12238 [Pistacia integerrima]|uniref:Uncharacterized protein n=1 Tax=Pistacia integerrima TaxID=434235 RepID=A0ACC0XE72_9ROSI|nr:hypothetical protein Pint_12238 [Pistacia integerrima]